jgi:protein arginine N-methyltransferase 5
MVNDAYLQAVSDGFDFITAPMFHPRYRRDTLGISETREAPATRKFGHMPIYYHAVALTCKPRAGSDLVMSSDRWTTSVVGKLSPWLDLDSDCIATRSASERAFKQEIAWASHLGGKQSVVSDKSVHRRTPT